MVRKKHLKTEGEGENKNTAHYKGEPLGGGGVNGPTCHRLPVTREAMEAASAFSPIPCVFCLFV